MNYEQNGQGRITLKLPEDGYILSVVQFPNNRREMALMYYIEHKKGYEIVGEPVEFVDTSEFVQIVAHALEGDYKIFTHLLEVELQPELELVWDKDSDNDN